MNALFRFSKIYFFITIVLLVTEILIALYVHDAIVRPYIGDLLVVILVYCFIRSFFNFPVLPTAIGTLLFAYLVEFLQYCDMIHVLGWQDNAFARVVLGVSFEWIDMIAYTAGIVLVLIAEKLILNLRPYWYK